MYLQMETDGGKTESECYLADRLGLPLAEIRAMPEFDIMTMIVYYGRKAQRQEIAAAHGRR